MCHWKYRLGKDHFDELAFCPLSQMIKGFLQLKMGCREFDLVKEDKQGNIINNVVHTVTRYSDDPKQNMDQESSLSTP